MRVVDLDDHRPGGRPARVPAQVEAGRVEDVAEDAEVGDEGDLPAGRVQALRAQVVVDAPRAGRVPAGRGDRRRGTTSRFRRLRLIEPEPPRRPRRARRGRARRRRRRARARTRTAGRGDGGPCPRAGATSCRPLHDRGCATSSAASKPGPAAILVEAVAEVRAGEPGRPPALQCRERGLRLERPERVGRVAHRPFDDDPLGPDPVARVDRHAVFVGPGSDCSRFMW